MRDNAEVCAAGIEGEKREAVLTGGVTHQHLQLEEVKWTVIVVSKLLAQHIQSIL